jgi:hypothetical protein
MACKQVYGARMNVASATVTTYTGPTLAQYAWDSILASTTWQVDGTFRNARIEHATAPGVGRSYTYTLVHNGSDTAIVIAISGTATSGSDTTNTVAVSPGDTLHWKCVPSGTPTQSEQRSSIEFWGTNPGESGYASMLGVSSSQTWRGPIFSAGQWNVGNGGVSNYEIVAADGVLTTLTYRLSSAPGGAASMSFTVYKNNVIQDGSGGSVNTVATISGGSTTGSWTGSLPLAPGDEVYVEAVPSGGPATARCGFGVKFDATVDGESQCCALLFDDLQTTGGPYFAPPHYATSGFAWDATETNSDAAGPAGTTFELYDMRLRLSSTVSTGPITFTLRVSGANTALSVTLATGGQVGQDLTNVATITAGDEWDYQYALAGTPGTARLVSIGMVMYATSPAPPPIVGTHIIGSDVTVQGATHAVVIGVSGTPVVHTRPNITAIYDDLLVNGYLELQPIAAPGAPTTGARLYLDVADGDVKIVHANGNIDVIAAN